MADLRRRARVRGRDGPDGTLRRRVLPAEFDDLEGFADRWSLRTEAERWAERHASSIEEMREFYDAMFPRVDAALAYCDDFPLDAMPDDARNLLALVLSFVMVSFPVEVWGGPRIPDVGDATLPRVVSPVI
jgi:hypothetical protein